MITLTGLAGRDEPLVLKSEQDMQIDCRGLTLLPALVDPHVHFRTPGAEHKENWISGASAAIAGGVTHVCDMPNTEPPGTCAEALEAKRLLIDAQLARTKIPLRYSLYLGASAGQKTSGKGACALKIFMGSSTGSLLIEEMEALRAAFALAAREGLPVAVHAEDEALIKPPSSKAPSEHSRRRSARVAASAVEKAIRLSEEAGVALYILHVSTDDELTLIREAKVRGLPVYAEATPHHLFLSDADYQTLGTRALVNPPLRSQHHQQALWKALLDGTIDWIGTDHAPHLAEEKDAPYGEAPSGMPGLETLLPLLLTAVDQGRLRLADVVRLTHDNPCKLFGIDLESDCVLVDRTRQRRVLPHLMQSRSGWSPFSGWKLTGWPVYTFVRGRLFHVADGVVAPVSTSIPTWNANHSRIYYCEKSYADNAQAGPFFSETLPIRAIPPREEWVDFLGTPVASRIGVPAGPLLNSRWIALASRLGFDILTYKTIRSHPFAGHALPNVLRLETPRSIVEGTPIGLAAGPLSSLNQLSITNSFGNPTQGHSYLAEDLPRSAEAIAPYQALVLSVVGVPYQEGGLTSDFCRAAARACELGGSIIEANFSCPNVDTKEGALYQDPKLVKETAAALVQAIHPRPLIIKMGPIQDEGLLKEVLVAAGEAQVAAVAGINTVKMEILDGAGNPALGSARRFGGVCGSAVRETALRFVRDCRKIIDEQALRLTLIGMGGIVLPEHFDLFLAGGADFVQTATAMMWDPYIAMRYYREKAYGHARACT